MVIIDGDVVFKRDGKNKKQLFAGGGCGMEIPDLGLYLLTGGYLCQQVHLGNSRKAIEAVYKLYNFGRKMSAGQLVRLGKARVITRRMEWL